MKTYPPEKQLPSIPFDVAEWDDLPLPYPGGIFRDAAHKQQTIAKSAALPKSAPRPPR